MTLTPPLELAPIRPRLRMALEEDIRSGDLTTEALVPPGICVRAVLAAHAAGVVAGLSVAAEVFALADSRIAFEFVASDGQSVQPGTVLAAVTGPARGILAAERTALNFIQRMSGIATLTRRYVDQIRGTAARIYDTRKTTPLWRVLEKYAVRAGGGCNHRMGLYDEVLIKDNHIALAHARSLAELVALARTRTPAGTNITVEVETVQQLLDALRGGPNVVLLDNMTVAVLAQCVRVAADSAATPPQLEASGGITLENVRAYAETGVDRISVGALTHSAPSLDIGLDLEPVPLAQ